MYVCYVWHQIGLSINQSINYADSYKIKVLFVGVSRTMYNTLKKLYWSFSNDIL